MAQLLKLEDKGVLWYGDAAKAFWRQEGAHLCAALVRPGTTEEQCAEQWGLLPRPSAAAAAAAAGAGVGAKRTRSAGAKAKGKAKGKRSAAATAAEAVSAPEGASGAEGAGGGGAGGGGGGGGGVKCTLGSALVRLNAAAATFQEALFAIPDSAGNAPKAFVEALRDSGGIASLSVEHDGLELVE